MPRGNGDVKRVRTKKRIELKLPIKALSTNKLYAGRKTRSWHYKKFRRQVFQLLEAYDKTNVRLEGNLKMTIDVGFSSNLSDLSNATKGIEDVVAEWLGFNDRQIVTIELNKYLVKKGDEFTHMTLAQTNKKIDRRKNA